MWLPRLRMGHVALSAQHVTVAESVPFRVGKLMSCENLQLPQVVDGQARETQAWQPAVTALSNWLADKGDRLASVHVVLSGRFVRWQLLPWRPELAGAQERAAYATLCFQDTFGKLAQGWQVLQSLQPPGRAVPACAVDTALMQALGAACSSAGIHLASVKPYFASAMDRWQSSLRGGTVWFGVVEPDSLTLGLLQQGRWLGLQSQRISGDWRDLVPGLMAQMGIACGLPGAVSVSTIPLYLVGTGDVPSQQRGLAFIWLQPKTVIGKPSGHARMAMGV